MKPYMVQRVLCRDLSKQVGPDVRFTELFYLDYMGSSEFEFGAIPAAIRSMAQAKREGTIYKRTLDAYRDDNDNPLVVVTGHKDQTGAFADWVAKVKEDRTLDRGQERFDFWRWLQPLPKVRYRKKGGEYVPAQKDVNQLSFDERDVWSRQRLDATNLWWDIYNTIAWSFVPYALDHFVQACFDQAALYEPTSTGRQ